MSISATNKNPSDPTYQALAALYYMVANGIYTEGSEWDLVSCSLNSDVGFSTYENKSQAIRISHEINFRTNEAVIIFTPNGDY